MKYRDNYMNNRNFFHSSNTGKIWEIQSESTREALNEDICRIMLIKHRSLPKEEKCLQLCVFPNMFDFSIHQNL